jgi:hypothetical protein
MMSKLILTSHIVCIALGTGMSFSNLVNVFLAQGRQGEFAMALALQRRTIARIGDGVITFIWLSGLVLLWLLGWPLTLLIGLKIAAVVLLTFNHAMARRTAGEMMRTKNIALLNRLGVFIGGVFLWAIAAIVLAVFVFE